MHAEKLRDDGSVAVMPVRRNSAAGPGMAGRFTLAPGIRSAQQLQALAGNRAVFTMLSAQSPVQRCGTSTDCGCATARKPAELDDEQQPDAGKQLTPEPVQRLIDDDAVGREKAAPDIPKEQPRYLGPHVLNRSVQRTTLSSPCLAPDSDLQGCLDDRTRLTVGGIGKPGTRKVERGDAVRKVQQALIDLGFLTGSASGNYDQDTWNAVLAFKRAKHLGFENLGDVGPGTVGCLNSLFACPCPRPAAGSSSGCAPLPGPGPSCCPACAPSRRRTPPPVIKPGARTPCERNCFFDFQRCLNLSENPQACLATFGGCRRGCAGSRSAFEVCVRLLQPPVEVSGCNHAYVETPTRRYAIITPCTGRLSFASPSGGIALKTDRSPDPCARRPTCIDCIPKPGVTDLESCFAAQFGAYAAPSLHKLLGPNSNTFAGTLARACCANMAVLPPAFGCVPGWDDPPAPSRASTTCPSGPPAC
ncbi:MAG: peptidoglycan-binding protein [Mycobacteriales bacterium]